MKFKESIAVSFLAIAALILNCGPAWSQSVGETQNKRSGGESQTPMAPQPGNVGKSGSASQSQSGTAQSQKDDNSVGGTQSQRSSDSQTPLPSGPGNVGKSGSSQSRSSSAQGEKDTSVGGTQSQRSGGDSQTPTPKADRSAKSADSMKAGQSRRVAGHQGMAGMDEVREAQEALKSQGHDPGPIDGIMGSQTQQALKEFQSQNGLKQTGMLDAQTKQKLNMDNSSSSSSGRSDSMRQQESPMNK